MTHIDGVRFDESIESHVIGDLDGVLVPIIGLAELRKNKQASARFKDLDDLEHLPSA